MLVHWIWLATRQGLTERTKYELLQRYSDPEDLYRDVEGDYQAVKGMTPKGTESLQDKSLGEAMEILEQCRQKDIRLLTLQDPGYPARLKGIYDPPVLLYYKGTLPDWEERPVIGAVGTRKCSDYGIRAGRQLGYQLARGGAYVASGMAQGIDAAVLTGALAARGTLTVFLAGGVDVIYPMENRWLYEYIVEHGCILSEHPPGTKHLSWHFRGRNRLISGVSNAVLVVEAPERSGALITARHAMEQGRDVYAVPGTIHSQTGKGSNALLRSGASMVQTGWDILENYQAVYPGKLTNEEACPDPEVLEKTAWKLCKKAPCEPQISRCREQTDKKVIDNSPKPPYIDVEKKPAGTAQEQAIIDALLGGPRLTDNLIADAGLSYSEALSAMTVLEIRGVIRRLPGNLVALDNN